MLRHTARNCFAGATMNETLPTCLQEGILTAGSTGPTIASSTSTTISTTSTSFTSLMSPISSSSSTSSTSSTSAGKQFTRTDPRYRQQSGGKKKYINQKKEDISVAKELKQLGLVDARLTEASILRLISQNQRRSTTLPIPLWIPVDEDDFTRQTAEIEKQGSLNQAPHVLQTPTPRLSEDMEEEEDLEETEQSDLKDWQQSQAKEFRQRNKAVEELSSSVEWNLEPEKMYAPPNPVAKKRLVEEWARQKKRTTRVARHCGVQVGASKQTVRKKVEGKKLIEKDVEVELEIEEEEMQLTVEEAKGKEKKVGKRLRKIISDSEEEAEKEKSKKRKKGDSDDDDDDFFVEEFPE